MEELFENKNESEGISIQNDEIFSNYKEKNKAKAVNTIESKVKSSAPRKVIDRKSNVKERQKTIFSHSTKTKSANYLVKKPDVKIPKNLGAHLDLNKNNKTEEKKKSDENEKVLPSKYIQASKQKNKPSTPVLIAKMKDCKKDVSNETISTRNNINTPGIKKNISLPNKKNQVTSTPGTNLLPLSSDISSIEAEASGFDDVAKHWLDKPLIGNVKKTTITQSTFASQKINPVIAVSSLAKVSAYNPMELLYCQYLQAVFLETKAEISLKKKSHNAMEQLYGLWEINQELLEHEANLDLQIALFDNLNHINLHLCSQEKNLESIMHFLPDLDFEFKNLTKAIDNTRHQLPVKDVFLPDMKDLACTLNETEYLTESIVNILKPNEESLFNLASVLANIEYTVETELKELKRSSELIKIASNLTIEESSLQVQSIQESEI